MTISCCRGEATAIKRHTSETDEYLTMVSNSENAVKKKDWWLPNVTARRSIVANR